MYLYGRYLSSGIDTAYNYIWRFVAASSPDAGGVSSSTGMYRLFALFGYRRPRWH